MNKKRNIAVIGAGYWGKNIVRVLNELGALAIVCDSSEAILEAGRKTYQHVRFTSNISDVLENPSIVGVAIATPAITHFEIVKEALKANKDVYVEKPLAFASTTKIGKTLSLSTLEGEELIGLAKKKKKILMVGHILHYHPVIIKLKELIRRGTLGEIHHVYSHRLNFGRFRSEESVLWSFAPHDVSVVLNILGMPKRVITVGKAWLQKGIPDTTMSILEYEKSKSAHIFVSWLNPFKDQTLTVVGSKAMAVFREQDKNPLTLWRHAVRWNHGHPEPIKAEPESISIGKNEPLTEELGHFLSCIKTRKKPQTDGEEGLRVLRVLDACQQSLEKNGASKNL